jgi:hypothetical protein
MKWRFGRGRREPDLERLAWQKAVRRDAQETLREIQGVLLLFWPGTWWGAGRRWWAARQEMRQFRQEEGLGPPSLSVSTRSALRPDSWSQRLPQFRAGGGAEEGGVARGDLPRRDAQETLREIGTILRFLWPGSWWRAGRRWWAAHRRMRKFHQQEGLGPPSLSGSVRSALQPGSWSQRWRHFRAGGGTEQLAGTARGAVQALLVLALLAAISWAVIEGGGRQDPRLRTSGRLRGAAPR